MGRLATNRPAKPWDQGLWPKEMRCVLTRGHTASDRLGANWYPIFERHFPRAAVDRRPLQQCFLCRARAQSIRAKALAAKYCGQSYQSVQIKQDVSVLIK